MTKKLHFFYAATALSLSFSTNSNAEHYAIPSEKENPNCSSTPSYTVRPKTPSKGITYQFPWNQRIVGIENIEPITTPSLGIRIHYPEGTYDPASMINANKPVGGTVFLIENPNGATECLYLTYTFQLAPNFDYKKGGKLPGLYGGQPVSGGKKSDGYDGFTVRITWNKNGQASIYAYTPDNKEKYGSSFGSNKWQLDKNNPNKITLLIQLNNTTQPDGIIKVWHNNELVSEAKNILFRKTEKIKINGIVFSTFFGGKDESYSTQKDTFIDFYDLTLSNQSPY